jgi:hypothetical protein
MKKITLLMFAMVASFAFNANAQDSPNAEIILSQNTDEIFVAGGVACAGSDNFWLREYVLADEGVTSDILLTGVEFGVEAMDFDEDFEVYAWDYVGFPAGFDITAPPTAIASGFITVTPGEIGTKIRATFDSPALVSSSSTIVVAFVQPFADGNNVYPGITADETKTSYIGSEACALTEPATPASVGFPDSKVMVNIVADDDVAGVGENIADVVSVYPNPTTDVFNVKLPSNVEVTSSSLVDILGKTTGVVYNNGIMDVSSLASGVYFLNLDTNLGTYTQKVVKQ